MSEEDDNATGTLLERLRDLGDGSMTRRIFQGFLLPFRAIVFLFKQPSLWPLVIIPALINILLFGGSLYLLVTNVETVVELLWIEPVVDAWYDWARKILWYGLVGLVAILSIGAAYVFVLLLGGIVASPFNDLLSDRVETILLDRDAPPEREESIVWGIVRSIGSSLFILGSYCVVMAPILMLNLVPAVGQVAATMLGAGVSALFLTMEFTDSPLDRRGRGLRQKFELIEGNRDVAIGFGLGATLLFWLPVFNLLTIPFAVVGGTALGIAMHDWDSNRR